MENFVRKAFRSANVIGMPVKTPDQKRIGEIEELVIDIESGTVAYAVLSFGGHFGFGEKFFAVPWSEFSMVHNEAGHHFVVDTSADKLRKLPGLSKKNWPETATSEWDVVVDKHYQRDDSTPVNDREAWDDYLDAWRD